MCVDCVRLYVDIEIESYNWILDMRRFVFLLLVFLPLPFRVMGQVEAGAVESGKMIREVCQAAGKIKSLQCDFRQTKQLSLLKTAMVSEGKMYYKGGSLYLP